MINQALFIGLITLDLVYLAEHIPANNQKIVALDSFVAAGGPATNAAIAFQHLSDNYAATLLGAVGKNFLSHLILSDLEQYQVQVQDLEPNRAESPPVSSIIVTQATGDRAVISINAKKSLITEYAFPPHFFSEINIVLIDGHQMTVGYQAAQEAKANRIPIVIDGGSWKAGFDQVLPLADYIICSENFHPPGCQTSQETLDYLTHLGVPHIAITRGEKPIEYFNRGKTGQLTVPQVPTVDTLGAGDIFHGAFCHFILKQNFIDSLTAAAEIASKSCQFFGTRQWMG